jgi:glycosyltransferase involved in cell wall biosynthesis
MKPVLPLSVAIITLNEAERLPRCLASVQGLAAEMVVVDSGSQDRTVDIAREAGARVEVEPWSGYVEQKNKALERCRQPWVLCLDADEVLTPELAAAIRQQFAAGEPTMAGFAVNRRTWYLGAWIWHAWYPEWRLRLVRRDGARWAGLDVHEKLTVPGATGRLSGDLLHHSFRDLHDHLTRTLKYARIAARSQARRGRRFSWFKLLLSPPATFFKFLILKQGFRDGWRGGVIAGVKAVDTFAKQAFLLEAERAPQPAQPAAAEK